MTTTKFILQFITVYNSWKTLRFMIYKEQYELKIDYAYYALNNAQ